MSSLDSSSSSDGNDCWIISSWNVTGLSEIRLERLSELRFHVAALQETHLSSFHHGQRRLTAKRLGLQLLHGRVAASDPQTCGGPVKSRGVGFMLGAGISALSVQPIGKAWKTLWLARRLHVAHFPPRRNLPRGLRVLTVYAPVSAPSFEAVSEKQWFSDCFLEFFSVLDMNIPTIVCGDWNGTVHPDRDYEPGGLEQHRQCCPLLSRLVGPGGPLIDTLDLFPSEWDFTFWGGRGCSRCDSMLANRAALPLIQSFKVLSDIRDGGHCPIEISLNVRPLKIHWDPPRPQPPDCLRRPVSELRTSKEHQELLKKWTESEVFRKLDATPAEHLGPAVKEALDHLVALAGGWEQRTRRPKLAYDSKAVRALRKELRALNFADSQLRRWPAGPSPKPFLVEQALRKLAAVGISLDGDRTSLTVKVRGCIRDRRQRLNGILAAMRRERALRWKDALPNVWARTPGRVFAWLRDERSAWGSVPLVSDDGQQIASVAEVDRAAQDFWVRDLWCRDDPSLAQEHWEAFSHSEFFPCIPKCSWPETQWTTALVKSIVHSLKPSAPGTWDVPVAVWQTLPDTWHAAVARMLQQIQDTGDWPENVLDAYVALIPKGQGNEIKSQRPITVLELVFRIFAKGVVQTWRNILMSDYLGEQAMGFRSHTGARHLAQFLSDIVASRTSEGKEVWFAKFDIVKCYDSIPWWALWGIMSEAGVPRRTVRAFRRFYEHLRRHFRFGHVDGATWSSHNGLAQGCPAAPDMLNILLEPFHRWASAHGFGVSLLGGGRASSASFADDVVLIAESLEEMERFIEAYLRWCNLLGLRVLHTKTQIWCNQSRAGTKVHVGEALVETSLTFSVVGVVLGPEQMATTEHLKKRMEKAVISANRLSALNLPAPLVARLWRSVVLAQACYGAEVRDIQPAAMEKLALSGRTTLRNASPFRLARWAAPEVLMGLPFGDSCIRDPMLEIRSRQICWLHELANSNNIVGRLHRALATWSGRWDPYWFEPTPSLKSALISLGWRLHVKDTSLPDSWPVLPEDPRLTADVVTDPCSGDIPDGAFFTDGSVGPGGGGAAAVAVDPTQETGCGSIVHISHPRSSTHCELVGLKLAARAHAKAAFSDSLCALITLRDWGKWPLSRRLKCIDRAEVRAVIHAASEGQLLLLEKVKAHQEGPENMKAFWNNTADREAKLAASNDTTIPLWNEETAFADHVQVVDETRKWILNVPEAVLARWWHLGRLKLSQRRPDTLGLLYPPNVNFDWKSSNRAFRAPFVRGGKWVYLVSPAALKWTARARCGALASTARRIKTDGHAGEPLDDPVCPFCHVGIEDDIHMASSCTATHTAKVLDAVSSVWRSSLRTLCIADGVLPSVDVLSKWSFQLAIGLIPLDLHPLFPGDSSKRLAFFGKLSIGMVEWFGARMRERELLRQEHAHRPSSIFPTHPS